MKKRNKKYNPRQRTINKMKRITKDIGVVFYAGMSAPEPITISLKTLEPVHFPQAYRDYLMKFSWDWTLHLSVLCRSRMDNGYAKTWITDFHMKYGDVVESITETHMELLDSVSRDHVLTAGWIAIPSLIDLPKEKEEEIYRKFGAFDLLPAWEVRENSKETDNDSSTS